MLRLIMPAIVLAGGLALMHPASAESAADTAPDHRPAAAPAEQKVPPSPPAASPPVLAAPDVAAPATTGYLRNVIPAGFGWG